MTRELVAEDADVRVYDVFDADGELVGQDVEPKAAPLASCGACGRAF